MTKGDAATRAILQENAPGKRASQAGAEVDGIKSSCHPWESKAPISWGAGLENAGEDDFAQSWHVRLTTSVGRASS